MIRAILQQNMVFYAMAAICILGVISQLILNILYDRLIRDAENTGEPKGKFMKRLRQQYVTSNRLNEGMANVPVFVKKNVYEYQCLGFNLHQWRRIGGVSLVLCLGLAGAGYLLAGSWGVADNIAQNYLWAGAAAALLLLGTQAVIDVGYKNKYLQVQLEDYLANSGIGHAYREVDLTERAKVPEHTSEAESVKEKEKTPTSLGVKKRQMRPLESKAQKDKRELKQNLEKIKEGLNETAAEREHGKERNTQILKQMDPAEQERVIREVLKEFLS